MTDSQKPTLVENKSVSFNPLSLLSEEQKDAIKSRFNNSWQKPRFAAIAELQKKYNLDFFTAAFTLSVQEDAQTLVSSKKVSTVSERMFDLAGELFSTPDGQQAALRDIETVYDRLDETQQRAAGIRFRNSVMKGFTHKMGGRILELVTEKLGIKETDWIAAK